MCEINHSHHLAYPLHVHIVFMTRYHRPVSGELHHVDMRQYVAEVCMNFDAELKEYNGKADHAHMLIGYPPSVQLIKLVNSPKSVTSRRPRNDSADLRTTYPKSVLWSHSYSIGSCGGVPLEVVKKYIQNQHG